MIFSKKGILVTGSSGFIGSKLIENIPYDSLITCPRGKKEKYFYKNDYFDKNILSEFEDLRVVHLATFFSRNEKDKNRIYKANISFGETILDDIKNTNIQKIIYTNTMYLYYKDDETRNLSYTKTKSNFGKTLDEYTKENKIIYEEIFLDNTFGPGDTRDKILNIVVNSVVNNLDNPLKNPDGYINITYIRDVVNRILFALNSSEDGKSSFISENSIELGSIYDFFKNYIKTKKIDINILKFGPNNYIKDHPEILDEGIKLSSIEKNLISLIEYD